MQLNLPPRITANTPYKLLAAEWCMRRMAVTNVTSEYCLTPFTVTCRSPASVAWCCAYHFDPLF